MTENNTTLPHESIRVDDDLELRVLEETEARTLFILTDNNRDYLAQYLPWVDDTTSVRDSLIFIRMMRNLRTKNREFGFGIRFRNELVGHISLMHVSDEQTPEIGYWIDKNISGKGITSRAAEAVTDFGLHTLQLDKIVIRARIDNTASNKIAEKIGYSFTDCIPGDDGHRMNHWIIENK